MKVLVIGATGATGSIAVRLLLEAGHQVTAFVRDPAKFTRTHGRPARGRGDARDAASLDAAVAGQHAVLAAFGTAQPEAGQPAGNLCHEPERGHAQAGPAGAWSTSRPWARATAGLWRPGFSGP